MLEDLQECLRAFQEIDTCGKVVIGILAALVVGGIIALFILVAILPNASIGVSALLTAIGAFLTGRASR